MRVHLVHPSDTAYGTAVVTPRWLFVLAAATPRKFGDPLLIDESLAPFDLDTVQRGDVVGIGIHTANALRGYTLGKLARERGAYVIFGGIHPTIFPDEPHETGGAHSVVRGDGDLIWAQVLEDCTSGTLGRVYEGGRVSSESFKSARWDLLPPKKYMWATVQTLRGCPKHCSFCSVWKTDGQKPRQRTSDAVVEELVELRRRGFRYVVLADDNFYPVSLTDLKLAAKNNPGRLSELQAIRAERFELMSRLSRLPSDMVFFTQITMEAAEDPDFLQAMHRAHIKGALVGIEAVTPEGLKDVFKDFNSAGEELVQRLRTFRKHGVHVLGSFIFGLPSDRENTFAATAAVAERADLAFAQFVMLTPFPGTVDYKKWENEMGGNVTHISGVPITRRWLIPHEQRPKLYCKHPVMSEEDIRQRTQAVWDSFYSLPSIWRRAQFIKTLKNRLAFVLISKIYRQMYADTGIANDSARAARSTKFVRWLTVPCQRLFAGRPMPDLQVPQHNTVVLQNLTTVSTYPKLESCSPE
ncbi:MAG TPA: radical SAM protein [Terriglobales bacterium]|nr:radical SAM protein [Terriglobales bacterium]